MPSLNQLVTLCITFILFYESLYVLYNTYIYTCSLMSVSTRLSLKRKSKTRRELYYEDNINRE